jgi:hypothetical protein
MEKVTYKGGPGDRFVLLVVTKRYGGDPVSPLYESQARQLVREMRDAGYLVRLIRSRPDGDAVEESDF